MDARLLAGRHGSAARQVRRGRSPPCCRGPRTTPRISNRAGRRAGWPGPASAERGRRLPSDAGGLPPRVSTCWTSTGSRWVPRRCGRGQPCTVPSSPRLATRHAARAGDAEQLLLWSERWRATALTAAPVRPPDDDELAAELSALRGVTRRIAELRADGASTVRADEEQARLEASVRGRMLRTSGTSGTRRARRSTYAGSARHSAATTLVELVEVDGTLHVVTVGLARHPAARGRVGGAGRGRAGLRALRPAPGRDVDQLRRSTARDVVARDQRRVPAGGTARPGGRAPRQRRGRRSCRPVGCTRCRGRCCPRCATAPSPSRPRWAAGCERRSTPKPRHHKVTLVAGRVSRPVAPRCTTSRTAIPAPIC